MVGFDDKLLKFYESEGRSVIKSERFINLSSNINHMMVNYVSFPKYQFEAVMGLFRIFVKQTGMRFIELQDEDNWTDFVAKLGQPTDPKVRNLLLSSEKLTFLGQGEERTLFHQFGVLGCLQFEKEEILSYNE